MENLKDLQTLIAVLRAMLRSNQKTSEFTYEELRAEHPDMNEGVKARLRCLPGITPIGEQGDSSEPFVETGVRVDSRQEIHLYLRDLEREEVDARRDTRETFMKIQTIILGVLSVVLIVLQVYVALGQMNMSAIQAGISADQRELQSVALGREGHAHVEMTLPGDVERHLHNGTVMNVPLCFLNSGGVRTGNISALVTSDDGVRLLTLTDIPSHDFLCRSITIPDANIVNLSVEVACPACISRDTISLYQSLEPAS